MVWTSHVVATCSRYRDDMNIWCGSAMQLEVVRLIGFCFCEELKTRCNWHQVAAELRFKGHASSTVDELRLKEAKPSAGKRMTDGASSAKVPNGATKRSLSLGIWLHESTPPPQVSRGAWRDDGHCLKCSGFFWWSGFFVPRKMLNRCEVTSQPSPLAVYSIASTDIDPFWEKNASEPGLFCVVDT